MRPFCLLWGMETPFDPVLVGLNDCRSDCGRPSEDTMDRRCRILIVGFEFSASSGKTKPGGWTPTKARQNHWPRTCPWRVWRSCSSDWTLRQHMWGAQGRSMRPPAGRRRASWWRSCWRWETDTKPTSRAGAGPQQDDAIRFLHRDTVCVLVPRRSQKYLRLPSARLGPVLWRSEGAMSHAPP